MKNNLDTFNFGFYTMNNKNRSNYIKYHEPTKLYPSNSGKININLNSYRHNSNLNNNHHYAHKKKENSNNFNTNHNSKQKQHNVNLTQMLNNLKREIVEISNNIKETDSKVEYYMNKNFENSKKMRSNSANISKNIILLPKQRSSFSNRGISLDMINSNYSKSSNYIINNIKKENSPVNEYISNVNTNTNTNGNNTLLTYNLYSKKNNNTNINRLTIQVTNNNPLHKICCLNANFNKRKLYNNYVNDIRPKYHTAENFYHIDKKKKLICNKNKNSSNYSNNDYNNGNNATNDNSNKISEKSSIYINTNYQDYINESIKKIPKSSSSNRNNFIDKNSNKVKNDMKNKIGKFNYKRGSLEKHILDLQDNIASSNNIMPGLFSSANSMKKELETLKSENEELKLKYYMSNNDTKNKKLLLKENKLKDEQISNLNKEIQRLNNTINIKDSIINILKYGNNNCNTNCNYNYKNMSDNNSINEIYGSGTGVNNINSQSSNVSNIILNNKIKSLQNEISKLRYNFNLQRNDEFLNLQNRNKELIQKNFSLK